MLKDFPDNICEQCGRKVTHKELYVTYKVIVVTNIQYYFVDMKHLIDELGDFTVEKGYHISASQIILLRPDLLKNYLSKKFYPEEIIFWFLCEKEVCDTCFEKQKLLIPER